MNAARRSTDAAPRQTRRRWVAAVAALCACASPGLPPGGPPDSAVPQIVRISPDTNATNVKARTVLIHFNEVIAERPSGQGGGGAGGVADLSAVVSLSPSDGRDRVTWRRTAIEIEPRRGFRPNTAYRVTIQPGVADLRGNVLRERVEFVFSTGNDLPTGEVAGAVFDYAAAKPAQGAQVELFTPDDTTFRWRARSDSTGRFTVRDLMPGTYVVRGYLDGNNDRQLGSREAFDTSRVTLTEGAEVDLYAFVHDTLSPRLELVTAVDSTALALRFDRVVVGDWTPSAGAITLVGEDSLVRTLAAAVPTAKYDSLRAAAARAARDSAAATDSAAVADSVAAPAVAPAAAPSDSAVQDTIPRLPPPKFERIVPWQQWTVPLEAPLAPGLYRLTVRGAPGLNGIARDTEREFRIRAPEPPKEPVTPPDSVPPDSARPPSAASRGTPPTSGPPSAR